MKVRVKLRLADAVDDLFARRTIVLDDGAMSREIARALSPLRDNGHLVVGWDRHLKKSVLVVNGYQVKHKSKKLGESIFELT